MNSIPFFLTGLSFCDSYPIQLNMTVKMNYSKFNKRKTGEYSEKGGLLWKTKKSVYPRLLL